MMGPKKLSAIRRALARAWVTGGEDPIRWLEECTIGAAGRKAAAAGAAEDVADAGQEGRAVAVVGAGEAQEQAAGQFPLGLVEAEEAGDDQAGLVAAAAVHAGLGEADVVVRHAVLVPGEVVREHD